LKKRCIKARAVAKKKTVEFEMYTTPQGGKEEKMAERIYTHKT
jgi:hypothetical protein